MLKFKYLGCVYHKLGTDEAECCRKVVSWRRVAGAINSLVNARGLQLECARFLLMPFLRYSSETMIWKEKERSRIRTVQMDNLRGFLGIRGMKKILNALIRLIRE